LNDLVLDARVVRNRVFLQEYFVRAGTLAKKPGFFSWMARVVRNRVFLQEYFVRADTLAKKPGFFSWMARVVRNRVFLQEYFVRADTLAKKPGFEESECVQDFSSCFLLPSSLFHKSKFAN
jgi:hypothetical protein